MFMSKFAHSGKKGTEDEFTCTSEDIHKDSCVGKG